MCILKRKSILQQSSITKTQKEKKKQMHTEILVWWCVPFCWQMHRLHLTAPYSSTSEHVALSPVGNLPLNVCSVRSSVMLPTLSFHRTVCLSQPCQNLPKGVACQSAQCVRTRQEPGRITSPAWPGAPSCPWTTAQLWTGNKRWEIGYKTTQVREGPKDFSTWVNRNYIDPRYLLDCTPYFRILLILIVP